MRDLTMTLRKLTIGHPERVATAHTVLTHLGISTVADLATRYDALSARECDAAIKALAVVLDRSDDDVLGAVLSFREA
jgi:hypothetical protein